jgi:hypothetical protein
LSNIETGGLHLLTKAFQSAGYASHGPGEAFGQPFGFQMLIALFFIDKACHHSRQHCRIVCRKKIPAQPLGHQQGLIDAQLRGPQAVFGQMARGIHEAGLYQEVEVVLKIAPQVFVGRGLTVKLRPVPLIGCQRFLQKILDLLRCMREQQIQCHGEVDSNLAVYRRRRGC